LHIKREFRIFGQFSRDILGFMLSFQKVLGEEQSFKKRIIIKPNIWFLGIL
jgi:hypothetical protein